MPHVDDNPVLAVAIEGFLERFQRGEQVSVEAWARAYPDVADELRELLPPLIEMDLTVSATEDIPQQALPPRIGDCRIVRELGRGGMGVVYEGVQEGLDRRVAVKVLLGATYDATRQVRFLREAKLVASLDHPNIIPTYAVGTEHGSPYLVMRLVRGHSLSHLADLPDAMARQRRAVALVLPVAKALAFAHARGITHRDIKPANILQEDDTGQVYLCDFGLAKAEDSPDLTSVGMVTGTLMYLAPERLSGVCDARSDVYALGLSLLELASGRTAFSGMDQSELVRRIVMEGAPPPLRHDPSLDRGLAKIIAKATARDPNLRTQSAEDLAAELAGLVIGRPGGPAKPGTGREAAPAGKGQAAATFAGLTGPQHTGPVATGHLAPGTLPPLSMPVSQPALARRGAAPGRPTAATRAQPAAEVHPPRQEPPSAWRTLFPIYGTGLGVVALLIWVSSTGTTAKPAAQPETATVTTPAPAQVVVAPTPAPQPYTPVVQGGATTVIEQRTPTPVEVPAPAPVAETPAPAPELPAMVVPDPTPAPVVARTPTPEPAFIPPPPPRSPDGKVWTAPPGEPGGPPALPPSPDGHPWTAPPGEPGGPPLPPPSPDGRAWTAPPGQPGGPPLPPDGGPGGGPGGGGPQGAGQQGGGQQGGGRPPGGGQGGGQQGGGQRPRR